MMGTSTFVIGDNGVIVFDGGGAPIMSERLMAKIATLTDKPITHLVISHWHGDHMFGVFRIVEEFSDVQVNCPPIHARRHFRQPNGLPEKTVNCY